MPYLDQAIDSQGSHERSQDYNTQLGRRQQTGARIHAVSDDDADCAEKQKGEIPHRNHQPHHKRRPGDIQDQPAEHNCLNPAGGRPEQRS